MVRSGTIGAILAAVVTVGAPQHTEAQAAPPTIIRGPGKVSCGNWLEARREGGASALADEDWVLGYVTAYNEYVPGAGGDIAAGTDAAGMMAWMDSYCRAHPLDPVSLAAYHLVFELAIRRQ